MKIGHVADLHLGKEMYTHNIDEDQRFILDRIIETAEKEDIDVLLVAGDVYDTANAPRSAMNMFDDFLVKASKVCKVYVVPGNHDSAFLVSYGNRFMADRGVNIVGPYEGEMGSFTEEDEFGKVRVCLMPYIRPMMVEHCFEEDVSTPDLAFDAVFKRAGVDPSERNVLVCHQSIIHKGVLPYRGGSENVVIGNDPAVSSGVFSAFDYVAAGHIHKHQVIGGNVSYSGCPLVYDRTEIGEEKGMNIVTLGKKGELPDIRFVPLEPLHRWSLIEGDIDSLISQADGLPKEEYVFAVLKRPSPEAAARLRKHCNLMHMEYDFRGSGLPGTDIAKAEDMSQVSPESLMDELFRMVVGRGMDPEQAKEFADVVSKVDGKGVEE